nr:rRNA 2'-O-methyltransferase fibrillarin isoform X2 [Pan troglodytes]XP_054522251.1 rRNA 2'-O-methyltransferase fibrillarin isoform X2 [Pan troglodytes]
MPPRGERSVGARRGGAGASGILQAAVRPCRGPCAGCGPAGRCAVSAGAGGRGRGGGAAQAAAGPGEWSNLTAGTRRRRARGNGGGGGGAGRLREAWAVTRAPERGPMVLEGPRRPVLQVT